MRLDPSVNPIWFKTKEDLVGLFWDCFKIIFKSNNVVLLGVFRSEKDLKVKQCYALIHDCQRIQGYFTNNYKAGSRL